MAFELGKTANGAKYVIGNNGNRVDFTQAVVLIKKEVDGNNVYVEGIGMEPIFCGALDNLLYMGNSLSSNPQTAIDFFKTEGWVYGDGSGSGSNSGTEIYTKDYEIDSEIESGASLPVAIPFAELSEGIPYSISFAGVPTGLIVNYTISTSGSIDVEFSNTSPDLIPFHNTITITAKK
ncbi:hypothetical protein U9K52_08465 [Chryseobacterium sp. MHB01]|uniref:hypothetical protein n=1 Tax=Chryseobacterium sp. MHB01 TaxID=3109433 RepID=UPI002AFE0544|nr:hypothetical protein [Chryseobacterium sp. MHB01]MEA1848941.1 hypothetical protein [Chryseobacterium sp. MHB01]